CRPREIARTEGKNTHQITRGIRQARELSFGDVLPVRSQTTRHLRREEHEAFIGVSSVKVIGHAAARLEAPRQVPAPLLRAGSLRSQQKYESADCASGCPVCRRRTTR